MYTFIRIHQMRKIWYVENNCQKTISIRKYSETRLFMKDLFCKKQQMIIIQLISVFWKNKSSLWPLLKNSISCRLEQLIKNIRKMYKNYIFRIWVYLSKTNQNGHGRKRDKSTLKKKKRFVIKNTVLKGKYGCNKSFF